MEPSWTVQGITELGSWILHRPGYWPADNEAEILIDAHLACGITNIAWELGRSVLTYHSDIPGATCHGVGRHWDEFSPTLGMQQRAEMKLYHDRCQLRVALTFGKSRGCTIYGRLCMNRHYGPGPGASDFARNNPRFYEIARDGWLDTSRLCYAIPEYRQERVAILKEATLIGCDGLVLDFCRQPPAVRYHPAFVNPYRERTGIDPRSITLSDKERFLDWCRFRAGFVTELLRDLKSALDPHREKHGVRVPVQVRIPNDGFEANLIAGFDVGTWCSEGFVDEIALSELRWLPGYADWDDRPYIALGAKHGITVLASGNCLPIQKGGWSGRVNPRGINPLVLARRALKSMDEGAQGISLYQTDVCFMPGLTDGLRTFHDEATLRAYVTDPAIIAANPVTPENAEYGIDNHSETRENLAKYAALPTESFWI